MYNPVRNAPLKPGRPTRKFYDAGVNLSKSGDGFIFRNVSDADLDSIKSLLGGEEYDAPSCPGWIAQWNLEKCPLEVMRDTLNRLTDAGAEIELRR